MTRIKLKGCPLHFYPKLQVKTQDHALLLNKIKTQDTNESSDNSFLLNKIKTEDANTEVLRSHNSTETKKQSSHKVLETYLFLSVKKMKTRSKLSTLDLSTSPAFARALRLLRSAGQQ
jgi:hypothetical protein